MKTILFVLLAVAVIAAAMFLMVKKRQEEGEEREERDLRAKNPLTEREQSMYFRLVEVLGSEFVVLSQVSFSALLSSRQRSTRNSFNRKYADFVICKKSFEVVAVVELDDASHKGKETEDAGRDELLTTAGYKVIRFKNVPNTVDAKKAIVSALNASVR